jgi:hypothetical protein
MLQVYPIAFLPRDHALAIAIMSYNGGMNFGLLGDFDSLPDIDSIGDSIHNGISELVALASTTDGAPETARRNGAARDTAPAPTR